MKNSGIVQRRILNWVKNTITRNTSNIVHAHRTEKIRVGTRDIQDWIWSIPHENRKMTSFEINYPWIWGAWPECTRTEVSKIIRNVSADPPFHTEGKQLSSMKIMSCLVEPSLSIKNHSTFKLHFFGEISNWQNYWHERPWKSKGLFFYHSCCLSRIQKNNTNSLSFKKKKTSQFQKDIQKIGC